MLLHMEHKANKTYSLSSISATITISNNNIQIVVDLWVIYTLIHMQKVS